MTRALILGGGMVGSAMAMDLSKQPDFEVTVADVRPQALAKLQSLYKVQTKQADLSDPVTVRQVCADYDIVLGALSSAIGLQTLEAVIDAGTNYVDISFMSEDATVHHERAKANGVTAIVDCGVAPGMSNMAAGFAAQTLDPCDRLEIYVGGLPVDRRWPYQYKAGFAPSDVLEEYTRPARLVHGGKEVVFEALTDVEHLDFDGIGTLEAFNTDGLRSLIKTLKIPTMIEKTMRYPGHAELMRVLRHTGFFSKEPVAVGDQKVVPLDLTSALLFPKWTFDDKQADLTVMRIIATGQRDGKPTRLTWDLLDYYDPETNTRSMSRTTAFPATIMASAVAAGMFVEPGVHPPEILGQRPGLLTHVLEQLKARGVQYQAKQETL